MSFDAIKSIADAENAAVKAREEAEVRAKAILKDASESNRKLSEQVQQEAAEINKKALEDAMERGELEAKVLKADNEEMNAIRKYAEINMDKAVNLIKERIVNG